MSDNDYFLIEEVLSDKLEIFGFDRNYEPTDNGIIYLTIRDKLAWKYKIVQNGIYAWLQWKPLWIEIRQIIVVM